jgi:hypothetical protein
MFMKLNGRTDAFTSEDVVENSHLDANYENQVMVIGKGFFKKEYQKPEYQLFLATGGFGCSPHTLGSAVFGKFLVDGEGARTSRGDFLGVLKPELVEEYGISIEKIKEAE